MSIFTPTSSNHAAPSFRVPTSGLARLIALVAGEWHAIGATRALRTLDDRALRDIGVSRAEIGHAVRFGRD